MLHGTWKIRPVSPDLKRRLARKNLDKADLRYAFEKLKAKRFL